MPQLIVRQIEEKVVKRLKKGAPDQAMNGFLLDTNILSELRKQSRCDAGVRRWFDVAMSDDLFVSVLVLVEIRQGIERIRLRDQTQAGALEKWVIR